MSVRVENDTFLSALLVYSGYWLFQVTANQNEAVFHFEMPEWSFEELNNAYLSDDGQGVSDIRAYGTAFKKVERLKGFARRNQTQIWVDNNWANGKRNKDEN